MAESLYISKNVVEDKIKEMKITSRTYSYAKQLNGKGRFGRVEIEINSIPSESKVVDNCQWKSLKESYSNYEGVEIWKNSALEAAKSIIEVMELKNIEIKINDIVGSNADTVPSHIGAALIIGVFDLLEIPLNKMEIGIIDDFISNNNDFEFIPNYEELITTIAKKA